MIKHLQSKIRWLNRLPLLLSLLGLLIFTLQGVYYAHHMDVTLDEGMYLVKGLLFIKGDYHPFQEYGLLTSKMPLAYLVPGAAQALFGAGLRTGRYFSLFIGMLVLGATWLATLRLAGRWWAAGVAWIMAVGPANIMFYTEAISQGLTAAFLMGALAFTLGKNRRGWQLAVGAALMVLCVMVRQNMAPAVPLLLVYIFWEHGWRRGLAATLVALLLAAGIHALYWPRIMDIWLPYLPGSLYRAMLDWTGLSPTRLSGNTGWAPEYNILSTIYVYFEGWRYNFPALLGPLASWILWPARQDWRDKTRRRAAICLSWMFLLLMGVHLWGALKPASCLYCYPGYLAFFTALGLLILAAVQPLWRRKAGFLRQFLSALAVALPAIGIGYGAWQVLGRTLGNIPVPRVSGMQLQGGVTELFRVLMNKFGWSYDFIQQLLPAIAGGLFGALLLLLPFFIRQVRKRRISPAVWSLQVFLAVGILLSPTLVFAGGRLPTLCRDDVITAHEAVGASLAQQVPANSLVYWENDISPLPLLYIPGVRVFAPQVNHWYTYLFSGDPDRLEREGYWSAELAERWKQQADYLLLAERYVTNHFPGGSADGVTFDEMSPTPETVPCRPRSIIHIFRRIK